MAIRAKRSVTNAPAMTKSAYKPGPDNHARMRETTSLTPLINADYYCLTLYRVDKASMYPQSTCGVSAIVHLEFAMLARNEKVLCVKVMPNRAVAALALSFVFLASGCVAGITPFSFDGVSLPSPAVLGQATRVLAADGSQIAVFFSERRTALPIERIPLRLKQAVIVIEDRRFYTHRGYDIASAARAMARNIAADDIHQGGSTITEQYVKNTYFPTLPRTAEQKIREAAVAAKLEREMSKDEILAEYLNSVYLGNGAFGVEAASRYYFGKGVEEISLSQAALLAGIIRAPQTYNPVAAPRTAFDRRNLVLEELASRGYIERNVAEAAKREPLGVVAQRGDPSYRYPYFVEFVRQGLLSDPRLGADEEARATQLYRGGLVVKTTIVPQLQDAAEAAARSALGSDGDPETGLISIDVSNGHIVAMVGGRDFSKRQFNLATDARRQAGSTFKAFGLVAALRARVPPQTRLDGTPRVFRLPTGELWHVHNYDRGGGGSVSLWDATVYSINAAFADLVFRVGASSVVSTAYDMGISTGLESNPAVVLGGTKNGVSVLEMASAFVPFATGGVRRNPIAVEYVEFPGGRRLSMESPSSLVLPPGVAWLASAILQDSVARGTGRGARIPGIRVGGKTGTAENFTDAWFVGYTPRLSTAVWVGYPDALVPMYSVHGVRVAGGTYPAWIWRNYMAFAASVFSGGEFPGPGEEMRPVRISLESGKLSGEFCSDGAWVTLPESVVPTEREECPVPPQQTEAHPTVSPGSFEGVTPTMTPAVTPSPPPSPRANVVLSPSPGVPKS